MVSSTSFYRVPSFRPYPNVASYDRRTCQRSNAMIRLRSLAILLVVALACAATKVAPPRSMSVWAGVAAS